MISLIIKSISGPLSRFCGLPVAVFSKVKHAYLEESTGQAGNYIHIHITAIICDWQRLPHLGPWPTALACLL